MTSAERSIDAILERQGFLLLDGGLATELERHGHDLGDRLWSARLLMSDPGAISTVHTAYLDAGADCITTASYQATIPGFMAQGLSRAQARASLEASIALAREARDQYEKRLTTGPGRPRPVLVAASIGPFGAYTADGGEYRGDYTISTDELRAFHQSRWEVLAEAGADLLACETIPSRREAEILLGLLDETPEVRAWLSFSCRDGTSISDGTRLADCAALAAGHERVVAVGINCTAPRFVESLIAEARRGAPGKPIVVYPNSGETWDATRRTWTAASDPIDFGRASAEWYTRGARLIGGCCRTGPGHIRAMRRALEERVTSHRSPVSDER